MQCQVCYRRKAHVRVLDTHAKAPTDIDVCDQCYVEFYLDQHDADIERDAERRAIVAAEDRIARRLDY